MACSVPNPQPEIYPHGYPVPRRWDAPACLRLWHLGSLDAPTVAVVWTLAFARAAGVSLPLWVPVLIGLTAWAVYVGDRLLDARAAIGSGRLDELAARHWFHYRYRWQLAPLGAAAACAAAGIVLTMMPGAARERDSVLGLAALAYFTQVHSPRRKARPTLRKAFAPMTKEMLVGLLFTAACVLPEWSRLSGPSWPILAVATYFSLLAWLNCYAIDRWERANLSQKVFALASGLALAGSMMAVYVAAAQPRMAELLAMGAAGSLLLGLLDKLRGRLTPVALRAAADLVLLTPLALLLQ